jgi:hypothetical protein
MITTIKLQEKSVDCLVDWTKKSSQLLEYVKILLVGNLFTLV